MKTQKFDRKRLAPPGLEEMREAAQISKKSRLRFGAKSKKHRAESPSKSPGSSCHDDAQHPDHSSVFPRLSRAQGQLVGIERMIRERRYCVDILVQFKAVMSALRTIEVSMYETHLRHCVKQAMASNDQKEIELKIQELSELLVRRSVL